MTIDALLASSVCAAPSLAAEAAEDISGGVLGDAAMRAKARRMLALRDANQARLDVYLQKHRTTLEHEARRLLTSHCSAEDAVQDAAVKALTTSNQFDPARADTADSGFRAWFYTILRNVCIDMTRQRARAASGIPFTNLPEIVIEEASVDPAPDPCAALLYKLGMEAEHWEEVVFAFHSLKGQNQEVLQECIINEREEVEVAAMWGFTPGAIRSRLMEAKNELRRKVEIFKKYPELMEVNRVTLGFANENPKPLQLSANSGARYCYPKPMLDKGTCN